VTTETIAVVNTLGIHARPAAQIVRCAARFASNITLTVGSETINAKSIMGVMTLAACRGSLIEIRSEGEDEAEAAEAIAELIRNGFGED
jgi:phosphocarrier protein HPr